MQLNSCCKDKYNNRKENKMEIRIKFAKYDTMKFISHLEVMRYFQKAVRRSGLDVAYTEGFNPHQIMSFAAPLGVGITSDGEYFDIEVHSTKSSKEMIADIIFLGNSWSREFLYCLFRHCSKSRSILASNCSFESAGFKSIVSFKSFLPICGITYALELKITGPLTPK